MSASLVGSEMCIRDSHCSDPGAARAPSPWLSGEDRNRDRSAKPTRATVSYTHLTLPTICSV
eukprot:2625070-Alexandrium_andersonii.AAC.1